MLPWWQLNDFWENTIILMFPDHSNLVNRFGTLFYSCCPCHIFFVFSFLSSLFSHRVLYQQSPTPSVFYCRSPFYSNSFQISLNVILPSVFLASLFLPLSEHLLSMQIFHLPFFPNVRPISAYSLITLFIKLLRSQIVHSSLIRSLHSHDYSYPDVFANLHRHD